MSYKKRNHKTSLILNTLPEGQGVQYGESAQHNRFFRILSSCLRSVGATKRNISLQVIVLRWEGRSCLWPSHTLDAATPACFGVKNLISFWAFFRHFYFLSHIDYIKTISTLLGHASTKITLDTYIHLIRDTGKYAVEMLEAIWQSLKNRQDGHVLPIFLAKEMDEGLSPFSLDNFFRPIFILPSCQSRHTTSSLGQFLFYRRVILILNQSI